MTFSKWLAALMLGAAGVLPAAAQTVPAEDLPRVDPSLQQERTLRGEEYYQEQQPRPPEGPVIEGGQRAPGGQLPEDHPARFTLAEIRFNASAFIAEERLREIAADYLRREIGFAALNDLVERINDIYAERGIVTARALIPPQRIEGGVLQVRLVEGRLGELELTGTPYTDRDYIAARLPLTPGEVVDVPALREALNYFNRTGNLSLRASLAPGAEPGESDVQLEVVEPPRFQGQLFIDNAGSETTGEERLGAFAMINGPFGRDDRFTAFLVGAEGALNALLSYELPVNRSGGRLRAHYAQGEIEIVQGPFVALDISGESSEIGLGFEQPFLRQESLWLDGYLRGAQSSSTTDIADSPLSEYEVQRLELGGLLRGFGAGYEWSLRQGIIRASVEDVFGQDDDYLFLDGDATYLRAFGERTLGLIRGGWQYAQEETAPPALLYQVGGVDTVRGYPAGAVAGATGLLLSFEGRYRWRRGLQPFAFFDYGRVEDVSPERADIMSAGAGMRWQYGRYISGELVWGQTLEQVLPDQDSGRIYLRVAFNWPGQ